MADNLWIFLGLLITAGMPVVLAFQANRAKRMDREADNARADELFVRTQAVAVKVDQAADLLAKNTVNVAVTTSEIKDQVVATHVLVNSSHTLRLERELVREKGMLTLMQEVRRLNMVAGDGPSSDAEASIQMAKDAIHNLEDEIRRQLSATQVIDVSRSNR